MIKHTTFLQITESDLTITSTTLSKQIIKELHEGNYTEALVEPVITAMNNLLASKDNGKLKKKHGLYVIESPRTLSVGVIDKMTPNHKDMIAYVFSDDLFYEQSIVRHILDAFAIQKTVKEYRIAVIENQIAKETQITINHAIELSTNLFDYMIKKEE